MRNIPDNFTGVITLSCGDKEWYKEGVLHRLEGPAIESAIGLYWYKEGFYHREDGPAVEYKTGEKFWYKEGSPHRIDGPAVEFQNGVVDWWVDGKNYSKEMFKTLTKTSVYLGKEKGRYNLDWLRFLTDQGIKEFPIILGMDLINFTVNNE